MADHEGPWRHQPPAPKPPRRGSRLGLLLWLGLLAAVGGGILLLSRLMPGQLVGMDKAEAARDLGVLAVVSSGLVYSRGLRFGVVVRNIALWAGVLGVVLVGYAYRTELNDAAQRVRGELIPAYAVKSTAREMVLTRGEGGQFYVWGSVNGVAVQFAIDTGASDIVLSPDDARRAGIEPSALTFNRTFGTANGVGRGADATVGRLDVGTLALSNVPVSVNSAPMGVSLLGATFLRRLESFEVRGDRLVLHWRA